MGFSSKRAKKLPEAKARNRHAYRLIEHDACGPEVEEIQEQRQERQSANIATCRGTTCDEAVHVRVWYFACG